MHFFFPFSIVIQPIQFFKAWNNKLEAVEQVVKKRKKKKNTINASTTEEKRNKEEKKSAASFQHTLLLLVKKLKVQKKFCHCSRRLVEAGGIISPLLSTFLPHLCLLSSASRSVCAETCSGFELSKCLADQTNKQINNNKKKENKQTDYGYRAVKKSHNPN